MCFRLVESAFRLVKLKINSPCLESLYEVLMVLDDVKKCCSSCCYNWESSFGKEKSVTTSFFVSLVNVFVSKKVKPFFLLDRKSVV